MLEWDYSANNEAGFKPNELTHGSRIEAYWKCKICEEVWTSRISNRTLLGRNCPYCTGKKASSTNNLEVLFPELAKEWDYGKNIGITPNIILPHTNKKYFWLCNKGHSYSANPNNRTHGDGCPYCSGNQVCIDNCLATKNSELAKEWHPSKNGTLTPLDITEYSNKKIWWLCEYGHEWEATVNNRSYGKGCKICAKGKQSSFPEQALFFYLKKIYSDSLNSYKLKGQKEIDIYIPSINVAVEYDGYQWHNSEVSKIRDVQKNIFIRKEGIHLIRVREKGCITLDSNDCIYLKCIAESSYKYLSSLLIQLISTINNLTGEDKFINIDISTDRFEILSQYKISLKSRSLLHVMPELAKEWDFDKNHPLKPDMVLPGSEVRVHWICSKNPNHKWEALLNSRSNGTGCPYCAGKLVLKEESFGALHPELMRGWEWNRNNELDINPFELSKGSGINVFWKCDNLEHPNWQASISDRVRGRGCPYCQNQKVCFENSLASINPKLAKEWDFEKNKILKPTGVTAGSGKKVWWKCKSGHSWNAVISSRNSGKDCPYCSGHKVSKETSLAFLRPDLAQEWCYEKNGNLTPADISLGHDSKVWWKCEQGHIWDAVVYNRVKGSGCRFCVNQEVAEENSLLVLRPDLVLDWDYEKNETSPLEVSVGSNRIVSWKCSKCGHGWETSINARNKGNGCKACYEEKRLLKYSLNTLRPDVVNYWDVVKNGKLSPDRVTSNYQEDLFWKCYKCNAKWKTSVKNMIRRKKKCLNCE